MNNLSKYTISALLILWHFTIFGQSLEDYDYVGNTPWEQDALKINSIQFNGYTNYWHNTYRNWYRYGNLYKISMPDVEKNILQSKVDIAEDMEIPGLILQEGFMQELLSSKAVELDSPDLGELTNEASNGDVLVFIDPRSDVGKKLNSRVPDLFSFPKELHSHQYGARDLKNVDAYFLRNGSKKYLLSVLPTKKFVKT